MQGGAEEIKAAGIRVVAVSYDSEEVLKTFAAKSGIEFPLLSDPDSKVIKQFGLLNKETKKGSRKDGIPHPMTVLVGQDGIVKGTIPGTVRQRHDVESLVTTWAKVKQSDAAAETAVADEATQGPPGSEELSGKWQGKTVLRGLKSESKSDPLDQESWPLDVSVAVNLKFDHSPEAISRFAQFSLSQYVEHSKGAGSIGMAGKLAESKGSKDGKEFDLVFHYRRKGVEGIQTRTIGKISRSDSGALLLTLLPTKSGVFDIGLSHLAPVEKLKLVPDETPTQSSAK